MRNLCYETNLFARGSIVPTLAPKQGVNWSQYASEFTQLCVVVKDKNHYSVLFLSAFPPCSFLHLHKRPMSPPAPTAAKDHGMTFLLWHGNFSGFDYSKSMIATALFCRCICILSDHVIETGYSLWCLLGVRLGFVVFEWWYCRKTSKEIEREI